MEPGTKLPFVEGTAAPFPSADVDNELLSLFVMASGPNSPPVFSDPLPWGDYLEPQPPSNPPPPPPPPPSQTVNAQTKGQQRLARKAELARASRLRKKAYVNNLENTVANLKSAVEELQAKIGKCNIKIRKSLAGEALNEPRKVKRKLSSKIDPIMDPFLRQRCANLVQTLDMADDCVSPGLQVKFALWGLDQPDAFYEKPGLWQSLLQSEIGLSEEQLQRLRQRRLCIRTERRNLAEADVMMKELREGSLEFVQLLHQETNKFLSIISPEQTVKLHNWVKANDWVFNVRSNGDDHRRQGS